MTLRRKVIDFIRLAGKNQVSHEVSIAHIAEFEKNSRPMRIVGQPQPKLLHPY